MYNPLLVSQLFPSSTQKVSPNAIRSNISTENNSPNQESFSNLSQRHHSALPSQWLSLNDSDCFEYQSPDSDSQQQFFATK